MKKGKIAGYLLDVARHVDRTRIMTPDDKVTEEVFDAICCGIVCGLIYAKGLCEAKADEPPLDPRTMAVKAISDAIDVYTEEDDDE